LFEISTIFSFNLSILTKNALNGANQQVKNMINYYDNQKKVWIEKAKICGF